MGNYSSLNDAVAAGITNMTVIRNNSRNDDGTDTITGVSWFYFNSVVASNLYISGNSWFGFGSSSEQLKVNRRDSAVYYIYREEGLIGTVKFLKVRWIGYSNYGTTADAYKQQYDVFLFDNGQIYLNFYDVPANECNGIKALVCGAATITYTVAADTPCEYTFTPANSLTGSGWSVVTGRPAIVVNHKSSGNAIIQIDGLTISNISTSTIAWTENKPANTEVVISVSIDGTTYSTVTNGGEFVNANLSNATLYVKVELSTADITVTPSVSDISLTILSNNDSKSIVLEMKPLERFESAVGDIVVAYNGVGGLSGTGGQVAPFSVSFTPSELAYKGNQNDAEHIELGNIAINGVLTKVYYTITEPQDQGHIELNSISVAGTLTHVNDL